MTQKRVAGLEPPYCTAVFTPLRPGAEHQAAKAHGREHWYESHSVHIGKVERSYGFDRHGE